MRLKVEIQLTIVRGVNHFTEEIGHASSSGAVGSGVVVSGISTA